MKTILAAIVIGAIVTGCRSSKEINVEMVNAQLIKIDTIYQNTAYPKQQLTWRDKDNIDYVSIVAMNRNYPIGMIVEMLRQR